MVNVRGDKACLRMSRLLSVANLSCTKVANFRRVRACSRS
jgi:hypothetical protein